MGGEIADDIAAAREAALKLVQTSSTSESGSHSSRKRSRSSDRKSSKDKSLHNDSRMNSERMRMIQQSQGSSRRPRSRSPRRSHGAVSRPPQQRPPQRSPSPWKNPDYSAGFTHIGSGTTQQALGAIHSGHQAHTPAAPVTSGGAQMAAATAAALAGLQAGRAGTQALLTNNPKLQAAQLMAMQALQQHNPQAQMTLSGRKIYIGNMPTGYGLNEAVLKTFFGKSLIMLGIKTPDPVVSVWISSEATFCFVELRSVRDAAECMSLLSGMQLGGKLLRIGRPADYAPVPPHLEDFVLGKEQIENVPADIAGVNQTQVLRLAGMITQADLKLNDSGAEALADDIRAECKRFGVVKSIKIPRPEEKSGGVGYVFVEFSDAAESERAFRALEHRKFGVGSVAASYFDPDKLEKNDFSA